MMGALPFVFKLSLDVMIIYQQSFAAWDANLVPAHVHFNNLMGMKNLGTLDSIIISKKTILNSRQQSVIGFGID